MCDELLHKVHHKHSVFREQVTGTEAIKKLTPMEQKCLPLGSQKHVKETYLESWTQFTISEPISIRRVLISL